MLTSDQSIVAYEGGHAFPDRLSRKVHAHYRVHTGKMIEVYRAGIGRTRRELHRSIEGIFAEEPDCDLRRIRAFARFIPWLLACDRWTMEAVLQTPWGTKARFGLSSQAGLRSHLPAPAEFDSTVEEDFARKFGEEREGWRLFREGAILHEDQAAFVPDFVFRHEDGTEALFEIVGFWTPEYLAHKREVIRRFRKRRILLAVPAKSIREHAVIPEGVLVYKTALKVDAVMSGLELLRQKGE
jgi:predicted nuclease of restriction endonuclease-like RecB superfamily